MMIGIVLWCDMAEKQAVIWSEGQDGLCYFDGSRAGQGAADSVDVGDVVQFDMSVAQNMRLARNVTRLLDAWGSDQGRSLDALPEDISSSASESAKIVPFGHAGTQRRRTEEHWQALKHG